MQNGPEQNADDCQKQDIRNAGFTEQTGKCVRHEDKKSDNQNVCSDVHFRNQFAGSVALSK
jgi:hypothetical protein